MRAFKIILIIVLALVIFFLTIGTIGVYRIDDPDAITICIFTGIGILLGLLAMLYHIKSFRYYRKSKQYTKEKKLSIVLWISSITSSLYCLFFATMAFIGITMNAFQSNAEELFMVVIIMTIFLYSIGSLFENSILKKRIKKQCEETSLHSEIDEIGL